MKPFQHRFTTPNVDEFVFSILFYSLILIFIFVEKAFNTKYYPGQTDGVSEEAPLCSVSKSSHPCSFEEIHC